MFLALIIICLAFSIAFALPKVVHRPFFWSMSARLAICLANVASVGQMPGAELDANKFFSEILDRSYNPARISWDILDLLVGTDGFLNVHALFQNIGGPDFLLSHSLSLLGSALCIYVIVQIWLLLCGNLEQQGLTRLILIYSITPSILTNQSYILREVWQSLCFLGIAWSGLSIQVQGRSTLRFIGLIGFMLIGSFMHHVMPVTIACLTMISLALANKIGVGELFRPSNSLKMVFLSTFMIILMLPVLGNSLFSSGDGGLTGAAESYSSNALMESRAEYGNLFKASNPLTIIPTFLAYQLMPIPGKISNLSDVIAFAENFWRVFLLQIYWRKKQTLSLDCRRNANMLLLMWFISELIWSVGTVNWGTASRHHVASYGLLLVVGLTGMSKKNSAILSTKPVL